MESECSRLQQELQDSKDQNELLEFRILELEVSHKEFSTISYCDMVRRRSGCRTDTEVSQPIFLQK